MLIKSQLKPIFYSISLTFYRVLMREEEVCLVKEKVFNSKSIASFTCGLDLYGVFAIFMLNRILQDNSKL